MIDSAPAHPGSPRKRLATILIIAAAAIVVAVVPSARHTLTQGGVLLVTGKFEQFRVYLTSLGAWAPVVSVALMMSGSLAVPIPATVLMVANGLVFGVWRGMLISLIGGMMGSFVAYSLGRAFGRSIVERLVPAGVLRAGDRMMRKYGGWAVLIERWIPGVPGDPASYVAGLTRMPIIAFLLLTLLGLVPADLVTAYFGANVAGDVPTQYWLAGVLVVALLLVWRMVRRRRKRAEAPPTDDDSVA